MDKAFEKSRGFTLVEMLVVIGIIAVLAGTIFVSMGKISRTAQRAKAQETVSNAATALNTILQKNMKWPKAVVNNMSGTTGGRLDEKVTAVFVRNCDDNGIALMGVNYKKSDYPSKVTLIGKDRFGIVTPWAADAIKKAGASASAGTKVSSGGTVADHVLYYAVDDDGDGITKVGSMKIRATAVCWCAGADGKLGTFFGGRNDKDAADDVYSFVKEQIER